MKNTIKSMNKNYHKNKRILGIKYFSTFKHLSFNTQYTPTQVDPVTQEYQEFISEELERIGIEGIRELPNPPEEIIYNGEQMIWSDQISDYEELIRTPYIENPDSGDIFSDCVEEIEEKFYLCSQVPGTYGSNDPEFQDIPISPYAEEDVVMGDTVTDPVINTETIVEIAEDYDVVTAIDAVSYIYSFFN